MQTITTNQFLNYLEALNLFRWKITETPSAFEAVISKDTKPNLKDFTQVLLNDDGTYWVRLSKEDINNELITGTFFKLKKDNFFTSVTKDYFVISYNMKPILTVFILEQIHEPKRQVLANIQRAQGIIKSLISGTCKYPEATKTVNEIINK